MGNLLGQVTISGIATHPHDMYIGSLLFLYTTLPLIELPFGRAVDRARGQRAVVWYGNVR
jgi:hypothetical protein